MYVKPDYAFHEQIAAVVVSAGFIKQPSYAFDCHAAAVHESRNRMRTIAGRRAYNRHKKKKNGSRHRSNLASSRDKAPETDIALRGNFRERGRGGPTERYEKTKTVPVTCNCDSIKSVNHRPWFALRFGN